jgi:polyhydroxybutyrate depolymerase
VFNLHGSYGSGALQEATTGTDATADAHTFAVAYPNGSTYASLPGTTLAGYLWNIPGTPYVGSTYPPAGTRDDVRFIADAIGAISDRLCIDPRMIYATGLSGGARMASVLACALSSRIAAIAPVAGVRAGNPDPADPTRPDPSTCQPLRPVPVIAFHGEADPVNPYAGGGQAYWRYSVPTALTRWATLNRCAAQPATATVTSTVDRLTFGQCSRHGDVELYRSNIGGHSWPGAPATTGFGLADMSISANELMWRFFRHHDL